MSRGPLCKHEENFHKFIIYKLRLSCSSTTGQGEVGIGDSGAILFLRSFKVSVCWNH